MVKSVLAVIAVVAMMINGGLVYTQYFRNDGASNWLSNKDTENTKDLDRLTVSVPKFKQDDIATYDYAIFAEMYWEDYESGNWSRYTLDLNGNLRQWYHAGTENKKDGFWQDHKSVHFQMDTKASFTLNFASQDSEPLIIEGSLDGIRDEYIDLKDQRIINTMTDGNVDIDRLPRAPIPLSFSGNVEAYPNPNRITPPSLDEQIYGDQKPIKKFDNGTVVQATDYEAYDLTMETYYNWSAESAEVLNGFDTLHINVSAMVLWGQMSFNEQIWISNNCPFPIKRFSRTNQTWEDDSGIFSVIIETTNTLQENGYSEGTDDIPWGTGTAIWHKLHPMGEYQDWNYMPASGNGYSASSFDFKTEEADQYARQHSPGLQRFLQQYDKPGRGVSITYAAYNASHDPDINNKAGSYRWNLSYGYSPTGDERKDAEDTHDWNFTYNIVLMKNITKDPLKPLQNEYIETIEIENDNGLETDAASLPKEFMPKKTLTLASSEDIMMVHPKVKEVMADRNGEIEWGDFDTEYGILNAGLGSGGEGMMMVELLTGISMPSADYAWVLQQASVYETGDTFSAAVDAGTGQLIYVLQIEGTALLGAFD